MSWLDIFGITLISILGFVSLCLLIYILYEHIIWWRDERKHNKYIKKLTKDFIEGKLNPKKLSIIDIMDIFDLLSVSSIEDNEKWCKILIKVYKYKIKKLL